MDWHKANEIPKTKEIIVTIKVDDDYFISVNTYFDLYYRAWIYDGRFVVGKVDAETASALLDDGYVVDSTSDKQKVVAWMYYPKPYRGE